MAINIDYNHDLDLGFPKPNIAFAICQEKWSDGNEIKSKLYRLYTSRLICSYILSMAMALTYKTKYLISYVSGESIQRAMK